jgi:photosystem II stability/assembly factor-like uncharacterized protein
MMKKLISFFLLIMVVFAGCESQGDKFTHFNVRETLLGKINNRKILKAFFINEKKGFAVIAKDTIVMTTDGCKTFSLSLTAKSSVFEAITFIDDRVGYVIDFNNRVFKTLDGGNTWTSTRIPIKGANLLDIHCLKNGTVFLAAGGNAQMQTGYIIKSADGGRIWETTMTNNIMQIAFLDDSTGFAAGYGGILKTSDCGKTWETISTFPANDILFVDANNGYFNFNRSLYKTVDGGKNWKLMKNITNPHWMVGDDFSRIENLSLLNDKNLIFSLNARLIKVTPEQKWFQYEFTRPYYQFQMINSQKGIVYGFENLILVQF